MHRPELKAEILKSMSEGGTVARVASIFGVSKRTVYNWLSPRPSSGPSRRTGPPKKILSSHEKWVKRVLVSKRLSAAEV